MALFEKDHVTVDGIKVAVDPERVSPTIVEHLRAGRYERQEAVNLPQIVQAGDRIVELGAGLGFISSLVSRLGLAESITVFEADPGLVPLIKRTHALNGVEAEVFNAVIAPTAMGETAPFYVRKDFWASSLSPEPYGYEDVIDVPVITFADMLARHRPTMLIVDIEGGEDTLFSGDVPLTGVKKVYLEIHQSVLGRVGMKRVFDFFSSRDFHYDQWHSSHGVILFSHVLR
jgi:FkbM family methyltransferase